MAELPPSPKNQGSGITIARLTTDLRIQPATQVFALISRYLTQIRRPLGSSGMKPGVSGEAPRGRHLWGAIIPKCKAHSFGLTPRMVAHVLAEKGFLDCQPPDLTKRVRLSGNLGLIRAFCIKASILEG